jgi:hypothetical protein
VLRAGAHQGPDRSEGAPECLAHRRLAVATLGAVRVREVVLERSRNGLASSAGAGAQVGRDVGEDVVRRAGAVEAAHRLAPQHEGVEDVDRVLRDRVQRIHVARLGRQKEGGRDAEAPLELWLAVGPIALVLPVAAMSACVLLEGEAA